MTKIAGSGSISQKHGSEDLDPPQKFRGSGTLVNIFVSFFIIFIIPFRRRLVCGNFMCPYCTAKPCGDCRRCLRPSSKNKCIRRYCKFQQFLHHFLMDGIDQTTGLITVTSIDLQNMPCHENSQIIFNSVFLTLDPGSGAFLTPLIRIG